MTWLLKPTFQVAARLVSVIRESAFDVCRAPLQPRFETVLLTTNVIVTRVCGRAFAIPAVCSQSSA